MSTPASGPVEPEREAEPAAVADDNAPGLTPPSASEVIGGALAQLTARGVVAPEDFPLTRFLYEVVVNDAPLDIPWSTFFGGEPA